MVNLAELAAFLNQLLHVERFGEDQNGIYQPSERAIRRIGLSLEPDADLPQWLHAQQLDALFLHRPWKLQRELLPADLGILAYHLAFDEGLTIGFNSHLAAALKITDLEILGTKQQRPIGMIGNSVPQDFAAYCNQIEALFGGLEQVQKYGNTVSRLAVVGAMTPELVQEAADRSADLYITGAFRQSAAETVQTTGTNVIAIGHQRCETWGIQTLAALLQQQWPELTVIVRDDHSG